MEVDSLVQLLVLSRYVLQPLRDAEAHLKLLAVSAPYVPVEAVEVDELLDGLEEGRELRVVYREVFDTIRRLFGLTMKLEDGPESVPDSGYPEGGGG
ncbi:MAG: hypothetical protein HYS89_01260 [Candidatus Colwellbacteria bacterium]|nr:hypothetical protein [Candidatus Colwellbacteria bacterium]